MIPEAIKAAAPELLHTGLIAMVAVVMYAVLLVLQYGVSFYSVSDIGSAMLLAVNYMLLKVSRVTTVQVALLLLFSACCSRWVGQ